MNSSREKVLAKTETFKTSNHQILIKLFNCNNKYLLMGFALLTIQKMLFYLATKSNIKHQLLAPNITFSSSLFYILKKNNAFVLS